MDSIFKTALTIGGLFLITLIILFINYSLQREVARQTRDLKHNETRLEALLNLYYIEKKPIRHIMAYACEKAVQLTESGFGYLAFAESEDYIFDDSSFQELMLPNGFRFHKSAGFPLETMGLWRDAVESKEPIIANYYAATNPFNKGIPRQYKKIERYMNMPVLHDGKVVAVAGVGNKKSNYTDTDLRQLSLLMEGLWRVIQRRESEQLIRNNEKQFRDLVENSLTGISIIQKGEVVYRNPEQQRLTGFFNPLEPLNEVSSIHPDHQKKAMDFFNRIKHQKIKEEEVDLAFFPHFAQEDTEASWVNCKACTIHYKGQESILLNTIDITQTKKMEQLLISQEKMVSLGHIAAGIAHEIRNPLAGIAIHLRNLEKKYIGDNRFSDKIKKSFAMIHTDAARIEAVVQRTLDFAKPASYSFDMININEPVQQAIQLTSVTLRRQMVCIESDLAPDLPLCSAEPHLMEDVIYNLIINAADAMKGQQNPRKIMITSWAQEDTVAVSVEDTGPGVPLELRKRIFDPFFTTKNYSTGIGLGICARIITDHKGSVEVLSGKQGGARFTVKIPVPSKGEVHA